jgi:hypothetical protein
MQKDKISIMIIALLSSTTAWACLNIPKKISLKNSPFFIKSVEMTVDRLEFSDVQGKTVSLTFKSEDNSWVLVTPGGEPQTFKGDKEKTIFDDDEVPSVTRITVKPGQTPSVTITGTSDSDDRKIVFTPMISKDIGKQDRLTMAFKKGEKLITSASVERIHGLNFRDLASTADGVLDFLDFSPKDSITFSGCGGRRTDPQLPGGERSSSQSLY